MPTMKIREEVDVDHTIDNCPRCGSSKVNLLGRDYE